MRSHAFCYFHARLHSTTSVTDEVTLPIPEDSRAIQESLGKIFQAILTSRVDSKKAAQILWGLQIASSNLPRKPKPDPKSVPSVTRNKDGVELAPVLNVCNPITECNRCEKAGTCDRFFDFDALVGRKKPGSDETGDQDKRKRPTCEYDGKGQFVYKSAQGEIIDRTTYFELDIEAMNARDREAEDDDDDDDDDEMDGVDVLHALRFSEQLKKTFEHED